MGQPIEEVSVLYVLRVSLPDRPGSLGQLASELGRLPADIVSLRVIDRDSFQAIDEICVEGEGLSPEKLREAAQRAPSVMVETVRRIARVPDPLGGLVLADRLARGVGSPLLTLVEGLPDALGAAWALALSVEADGAQVGAASSEAPSPGLMDTPWLPLTKARRLPLGEWAPMNWRMHRFELAAAPLATAFDFVLIGRWAGMRFRPSELRQLELLADMAIRSDRQVSATM
ncbi:MAG: amino acid-binding protein [Actinomycetota bacterium]